MMTGDGRRKEVGRREEEEASLNRYLPYLRYSPIHPIPFLLRKGNLRRVSVSSSYKCSPHAHTHRRHRQMTQHNNIEHKTIIV